MKKFLKDYWVFVSWLVTVVIDLQNGILEELISNPVWVNFVRILGAGFLAYFTGKKLKSNVFSKEADTGGGGVQNPPKKD